MVVISVLGPLEVRRDGELVRVPGGLTSQLLVRLALDAGCVVHADRLLDDLWAGEGAPASPNTLQSKVARLRRSLGDTVTITTTDGGYRLDVERIAVDALAVLDAAVEADRLLSHGELQAAADHSGAALRSSDGAGLAAAGDWAAPYRARLDQARLSLIETSAAARLGLGQVATVIGDLQSAVAAHPFHEALWVLLITALYRSGQQAGALVAGQRIRAILADELGLEPGPQLRQLEHQVLTHAPALEVASPGPASTPAAAGSGNLPTLPVPLIGRDADIDAVNGLLATNRLVEIVGTGGIGKTALALAVARAHHTPDGAWLVKLETATSDEEVVDAAVAALGVNAEAALDERLRSADALIVLDSCEHVVEGAASLATRLLDGAPSLRVLVTSQLPLDVDGEICHPLGPLSLDDAVTLFATRATARRTEPTAQDDAMRQLCRSLDGLPLAIELAAARTRTLSIQEIARRLDDRFAILHDPTSRRPERRRALRATIQWSYDLLFPDDQRGLWALSAFVGGAPLAGLEAVLAALDVPATNAVDVVSRLANRSLVIVDDSAADRPRYRLLDSIRAFADGELHRAGGTERAAGAHAEWYATAAIGSTDGVRSARQAEHLRFARTERANIDAALAWWLTRDAARALDLAIGFGWAWIVLGDSRGAQRLRTALGVAGATARDAERAQALLLLGWIEASVGHLEPARQHVAEALELAARVDDIELQARGHYYLAYVVSHHGEFAEGIELTDRSRALYADLDRPWDQAANELFALRAATSAGDEQRAIAADQRIERWFGVVHDPWLHVRHEAMVGELARLQRRFTDAVTHLERAAATSHRLGFRQTEAYQLASLGRALSQADDPERGAAALKLAIEQAESIGDVRMAALARVHLGRVLRGLGRLSEARAALEHTTAWHRAAGGGEQALLGECLLAALDAADGEPTARSRLAVILDRARTSADAPAETLALDALARLAADAGDTDEAAQLLAVADRRMADASHFISATDRLDARHVTRRRPGCRPRR